MLLSGPLDVNLGTVMQALQHVETIVGSCQCLSIPSVMFSVRHCRHIASMERAGIDGSPVPFRSRTPMFLAIQLVDEFTVARR